MKISILIPTYQGKKYLPSLLAGLRAQKANIEEIIVVDSSREPSDQALVQSYGGRWIQIAPEEFNHGATRTMVGKEARGDVLVYLTQDAIPAHPGAIQTLVHPLLSTPQIAATFGRQLAHPKAHPFAAHLRLFNYPPQSHTRSLDDRRQYGIKAAFLSNTFSAYRKSTLSEIGWFPEAIPMAEDMWVAAKFLLAGYQTAYVAEAKVYHSHNYSVGREFQRYFKIGVFHARERWILEKFGKPEKEGQRYLFSELKFLLNRGRGDLLLEFFVRNGLKYLGYKLGWFHRQLPSFVRDLFE